MVKSGVQSHEKKLGLPRRCAPRNDNLLYEIATLPAVARNQAVSQLIARFKMGNEQNILAKKEYLKCLFTLIIALNGKFLSNFTL